MHKFIVFFVINAVCGQNYYSDLFEYLYSRRESALKEPNYNETFFPSLQNYQVNAKPVTEDQYPWIASVIHARSRDVPYVCTAACVEPRIFVTAARCLFRTRVAYTTVINQNHRFPVIAFVLPSTETKQAFDDIGFIVVNDEGFVGQWAAVALFDTTNRTDLRFEWFAALDLPKETFQHVVVGYATKKENHKDRVIERHFNLTELNVNVNINICPEIMVFNNLVKGFHVPCYHSCSATKFNNKHPTCQNYHGVEGGVLLNVNTKKVLGIATWGAYFAKYELPVGFSVPNLETFFQDYTCARRIKEDKTLLATEGYYQALCKV